MLIGKNKKQTVLNNKKVKKQKLIINNNNNKIQKSKNFKGLFQFFIFLLFIASILVGSFFAVFNSNYKNYSIIYQGGYGARVKIMQETLDPNSQWKEKEVPYKEAVKLLTKKIDPIGNKNIIYNFYKTRNLFNSYSSIDVKTSKNAFSSKQLFNSQLGRPGYVYFTNNIGTDLLIKDSSRTKIFDVLSGVSSTLKEGTRLPSLTFNVKDNKKWTEILNDASKGKDKTLYIWSDLAYFIDSLRNISDLDQFKSLINDINNVQKSQDDIKYIKKVFTLNLKEYDPFNFNDDDLYSLCNKANSNNPQAEETLRKILKDSNKIWQIPVIGPNLNGEKETLSEGLNPSSSLDKEAPYIDPFRKMLMKFYNDKKINTKNQTKFNDYLLGKTIVNSSPKYCIKQFNKSELKDNSATNNVITMNNITEAKRAAGLINLSLKNIICNIIYKYNIDPAISKLNLFLSLFVFILVLIIIFLFLIFYYRLFGFILSLLMIFFITVSYLVLGVLLIEVGPPLILSFLIILALFLESAINFFEHYKKEYYIQNVSHLMSFKFANKKTFLSVIDYHSILLIFGLIMYWSSSSQLKMFSTILIITALFSFAVIIISRLIFFLIIKFGWFNNKKLKFLLLPGFFNKTKFFNFFKKNKSYKTLNNLNFKANRNLININNQSLSNMEDLDNQGKINSLEIKKPINKGLNSKKPKNPKKFKFNFNSKIKKILLITLTISIIIISAFLIGFNQLRTTFDLSNGTVFYLYDQKKETSEIDKDIEKFDNSIKEKFNNKFNYKTFHFIINPINVADVDIKNANIAVITTIKREEDLFREFVNFLSTTATSYTLIYDNIYSTNTPVLFYKLNMELLIGFSVFSLLILFYIIIRFNWSKYLAITGSVIFTALIIIGISIISQITLSLSSFLALIGIILYSLLDAIIICNKIRYTEEKYNIDKFKNVLDNFLIFKKEKKELKFLKKRIYLTKLKTLILSNEEITNKDFKKKKVLFKNEYKKEQKILKESVKNKYKNYKNTYKTSNNYLFEINKLIKKESIRRGIILTIILFLITSMFTIFGGISLAFGFIIIIGLPISIFSSIYLMPIIWIYFDKYRILRKLRVKNYLKNYKLDMDEENILGINK